MRQIAEIKDIIRKICIFSIGCKYTNSGKSIKNMAPNFNIFGATQYIFLLQYTKIQKVCSSLFMKKKIG